MKIEDVQKIAQLARLNLTETELQSMTSELTNIMQYIETLNELDLKNVNPTSHAIEVDNVFRDDVVIPSFEGRGTLAKSPDHVEDFFLVPKVL